MNSEKCTYQGWAVSSQHMTRPFHLTESHGWFKIKSKIKSTLTPLCLHECPFFQLMPEISSHMYSLPGTILVIL